MSLRSKTSAATPDALQHIVVQHEQDGRRPGRGATNHAQMLPQLPSCGRNVLIDHPDHARHVHCGACRYLRTQAAYSKDNAA
jgi:ribosomal protein S27AE